MSNAIVSLIVIALMMTAALLWSQASINMMDSGVQSWKEMVETAREVTRTDIDIINANYTTPYVKVLVQNSGKLHIGKFSNWDVFVQYYDGNDTLCIDSLTYTQNITPPADEWTVFTIYTDNTLTQQEVIEPDIINPGEVAWLRLRLDPQLGGNTTNMVMLSSPNGVTASKQFEG